MFIEPSPGGHVETPLSDLSPGWVAKKIGVGQAIVEERMRVLERRRRRPDGHLPPQALAPEESFEQVLAELAYEDPALRRRMSK